MNYTAVTNEGWKLAPQNVTKKKKLQQVRFREWKRGAQYYNTESELKFEMMRHKPCERPHEDKASPKEQPNYKA
jgi:hypothetical protein